MNHSNFFRTLWPASSSQISIALSVLVMRAMIFAAVLSIFVVPEHSQAKTKTNLSPAKVKQIKQTNKSYKECQKTALKDLKSQKLNQSTFKTALDSCRERFPGAGLYIDCKKKALAASKTAKDAADKDPSEEIAECRQYLTAAAFDAESPLPFLRAEGQLYFAGIGLNKSLNLKGTEVPNFDCERLLAARKKPADANYILFGNHPDTFSAWEKLSPAELNKLLKTSGKSAQKALEGNDGFLTPAGRLYGNPSSKNSALFFPAGACDFDGQTGQIFSGLSAYYLVDRDDTAMPYFGIAYFKSGQKAITTPDLIAQTSARLGNNYRPLKKNSQVVFIASARITETDDERDPRNLCRQPRKHEVIAVIQSQKGNPRQPEYLIVANVRNLCDYGDRLARRLSQ